MARSTLPAFDPLAELGISEPAPSGDPSRPARPRVAHKPELPPRNSSTVIAREPEDTGQGKLPVEVEAPAPPPQAPVSQPRSAQEGRSRRGTDNRHLTSVSPDTAKPRPLKAKAGGRIAVDVLEEVRDCVVWHGHAMTIDSFMEAACREHLKRLRRELGLGGRFPARAREPKQGRRVG